MARARTNVLSTSTINYLELIGNGKAYRVPPYQRDYAWTEEEWEDLWNDVLDLRQENEGRHYMGALVVQGESDREFTIIDGQQRLATISILSLAVIARLHRMADREIDAERNRERAKELRNRFVGEKDPASLIESSRLNLSLTDDAFYQDYLVQLREPPNPRGLPQSSSLLWRCFRYFSERLEALDDLEEDGEALARVLSETTARCLLFILIKVEDELDAYTVFETLNARGLELTTADLLKNYFFSRVRVQSDLEALQRRWQALIATVTPERFSDFLRYHFLCEHQGDLSRCPVLVAVPAPPVLERFGFDEAHVGSQDEVPPHHDDLRHDQRVVVLLERPLRIREALVRQAVRAVVQQQQRFFELFLRHFPDPVQPLRLCPLLAPPAFALASVLLARRPECPQLLLDTLQPLDLASPLTGGGPRGKLLRNRRDELHEQPAHLEIGGMQPPIAVTGDPTLVDIGSHLRLPWAPSVALRSAGAVAPRQLAAVRACDG